ncbi:hypothetical protein [Pseudomonas capsici]|uniref:hypothetical protein n=1 Tax=Pseudomonas capsici TaxID=2810614 RepID=UPI0021F0D314|nr:hypothetical protein [Pseudomonas capsici]MCV4343259.1 hypothetical protein [Pseudomonas capsici]
MKDIPEEWYVTVSQFIRFLEAKKRSSACPVCPHDGHWNFLVEDDGEMGLESIMIIDFKIHETSKAQSPDIALGSYLMECPNCGFVIHTSTEAVNKFLDEEKGSDG